MAITNKYVTASQTGSGHSGDDDGADAYTWAEFITAYNANAPAASAIRYNIKAGAYNLSASSTFTGDGTATYPLIVSGYNSTPGDLDNVARTQSGQGPLDVTNFPVITYDAGYKLNATGSVLAIWKNLKVVGAVSGTVLDIGDNSFAYRCYAENSSTNAGAVAIGSTGYGGNPTMIDCDAKLSGASGGKAGIYHNGSGVRVIGCHVLDSPAAGILIDSNGGLIVDNVIKSTGDNIACAGTAAGAMFNIIGNTCPGGSAAGVSFPNAANVVPQLVYNNHITGCVDAIKSNYSTTDRCIFMAANRRRDNTNDVVNFGDWALATDYKAVGPTTTGDDSTDYKSVANADYSLVANAPGRAVALPANRDIGALQHADPAGGVAPAIAFGGRFARRA